MILSSGPILRFRRIVWKKNRKKAKNKANGTFPARFPSFPFVRRRNVLFGLLSISFHYVQVRVLCWSCNTHFKYALCTPIYCTTAFNSLHLPSIEALPLSFPIVKTVFFFSWSFLSTLHIGRMLCVAIIQLNDKFHSLVNRFHVFFRFVK